MKKKKKSMESFWHKDKHTYLQTIFQNEFWTSFSDVFHKGLCQQSHKQSYVLILFLEKTVTTGWSESSFDFSSCL